MNVIRHRTNAVDLDGIAPSSPHEQAEKPLVVSVFKENPAAFVAAADNVIVIP
jgi:hypothetical protein